MLRHHAFLQWTARPPRAQCSRGLFAQLVGCIAPWVAADHLGWSALLWGCLSGAGTGIGAAFLYRAMARGAFSVAVPVSDVTAVALPVLVAVVLLGDRPGLVAWCGIAIAVPALWLITRSDPDAGGRRTTATGSRTR